MNRGTLEQPFQAISPTAKVVAYLRGLTTIPYAEQIAQVAQAEAACGQILRQYETELTLADLRLLAPFIELRYLAINAVLAQHTFSNFVELASGLSPRGLARSQDERVFCLQTDLPDILREQVTVYQSILGRVVRSSLAYLQVDATNPGHYMVVHGRLRPGSVAVVSEGLLAYLTLEQRRQVAQNILWLLRQRGGVWVTIDLYHAGREQLVQLEPKFDQSMSLFAQITGRDMVTQRFPSLEGAERFYRGLGFRLARFKQGDLVSELSCLERVAVPAQTVKHARANALVWALQVDGR